MPFSKKVQLETGHTVELYWAWSGECYVVTEIELWRDKLWLGRLYWQGPGKYGLSNAFTPRDRETIDRAVEYYMAKHPDLVGKNWRVVIEQGLAREVDLGALLDRANETGKAVTPCYRDCPYLAVDAEGRIYTWGYNPRDVYNSAVNKGWKGWFSQNRADEQTLRVVPASKVRVQVEG
jgi:hypothetical protein